MASAHFIAFVDRCQALVGRYECGEIDSLDWSGLAVSDLLASLTCVEEQAAVERLTVALSEKFKHHGQSAEGTDGRESARRNSTLDLIRFGGHLS